MRNLAASFISLQVLLTLVFWGFLIKTCGIMAWIFLLLWIWGAVQIIRLAIKRKDFNMIIWWFAYFDVFLLIALILLIMLFPLVFFAPALALPGIFLILLLVVYFSEKNPLLGKPTFESLGSEILLKVTANLPLIFVLIISSMGA